MREHRWRRAVTAGTFANGSLIHLRKALGGFQLRYSWNLIVTSRKPSGLSLLYLLWYPYITTNWWAHMPGVCFCLKCLFLDKNQTHMLGWFYTRSWWVRWWKENALSFDPLSWSYRRQNQKKFKMGKCYGTLASDTLGRDHEWCHTSCDHLYSLLTCMSAGGQAWKGWSLLPFRGLYNINLHCLVGFIITSVLAVWLRKLVFKWILWCCRSGLRKMWDRFILRSQCTVGLRLWANGQLW